LSRVVALRSAVSSATARNHQRVKSAGGWPRAIPMPRCQTAGAGDAASRTLISENFKKIQRPKTVRNLPLPVIIFDSYCWFLQSNQRFVLQNYRICYDGYITFCSFLTETSSSLC